MPSKVWRDFILKFAADFPAFILLRREHLVRQLPQPFLQLQGILQQLGVVFAAYLEGGFHALAADDAALQLAVGDGQFRRAPAQRLVQPVQLNLALPRGAMRLHDRGEGLGKKNLRPLDKAIFARWLIPG